MCWVFFIVKNNNFEIQVFNSLTPVFIFGQQWQTILLLVLLSSRCCIKVRGFKGLIYRHDMFSV